MAKKDWIGTGADRLTFGERLGDLIDSRGITQSQLAEQTGVNQSALSDYINKNKAPTCASIVALAHFFSVSTDYLLGLTADPAIVRSAVDTLGLTPMVVEKIRKLQECTTSDCDTLGKFNKCLENENIWTLLYLINDYITAAKAEGIYNALLAEYNGDYDSLDKELIERADEYHDSDIDLHDFLVAKAKGHSEDPLIRIGFDECSLSELIYLRIDRQLSKILTEIDGGFLNGID